MESTIASGSANVTSIQATESHSVNEYTDNPITVTTEDDEEPNTNPDDWLSGIRDMANMERYASSAFTWD